MRRNYKVMVQYGGARYDRRQRQGSAENTIQSKPEFVIGKTTGEDIEIIGSGRTDADVHATGQVINMHTDTEKTSQGIKNYVNQYLPDDIAATQLEEVPDRFHSRLNATGKVYTYWIKTAPKCSVSQREYVYTLGQKLDVEATRQTAKLLCGIHDFKSFCSNKNMKKPAVRVVKTISIQERGSGLEIHVIGDGFLCNMVRILVETLTEVGLGKRTPGSMREILEAKDGQATGAMALACGPFLTVVTYDN